VLLKSSDPEDGGGKLLRSFGRYLLFHAAGPRRFESSTYICILIQNIISVKELELIRFGEIFPVTVAYTDLALKCVSCICLRTNCTYPLDLYIM
jgi:hypothetical protein